MPSLRLHPVHIRHGTISAIPWFGEGARTCFYKLATGEVPAVVWTQPSRLQIRRDIDDPVPIIEVHLLLAEVRQDWDSTSKQMVVIVKPWYGAGQTGWADEINFEILKSHANAAACTNEAADLTCAQLEFWIFLVDGGEAAIRDVLRQMGEVGSIRTKTSDILEVGEPIGAGANSNVYVANYKHQDDVSVAGCEYNMVLKVLNPNPGCATAQHELDGMRHEITLVVHAGRHPNIVKLFGVFCLQSKDENSSNECKSLLPSVDPNGLLPRWALLSEYITGGDVFDAVVENRFTESRAHQVISDLLSALKHLHCRGIVHRDVKAENILLAKDGRAVLSDFGIAAFISDEEAMQKRCGSPGYIAPEVLNKKPYGIKIDSFGAGAVLYFIICGKLPFEGGKEDSVLRRTLRCHVSFDQHPEFLQVTNKCKSFILKLLQKDPDNRLSAEQAASQMWCISDQKGYACSEASRNFYLVTSSDMHNIMTSGSNDVNYISDKSFFDSFMTCEYPTPQTRVGCGGGGDAGCGGGGSYFHNLQPSNAELDNGVDRPSMTEAGRCGSSCQGTWSRRLNQLVAKFRTGKSDGSGSHRADTVTNRVSATTPRGKYKVWEGKMKPNPFTGDGFELLGSDFSDEEKCAPAPPEDYARSSQPSSSSYRRGSTHSRRLQALKSAKRIPNETTGSGSVKDRVMEPVPPASRPENPRPQATTSVRPLSRRHNKESRKNNSRDGKGPSAQSKASEDLPPSTQQVLLNDGQKLDGEPHGEIRPPKSPCTPRPAGQRRLRKARQSCTVGDREPDNSASQKS